jgi:hypothetical protein
MLDRGGCSFAVKKRTSLLHHGINGRAHFALSKIEPVDENIYPVKVHLHLRFSHAISHQASTFLFKKIFFFITK